MAPQSQARNPKPESIAENPETARLLTSLFTKRIITKGDKARKWHQHPAYSTKFSKIALEKFHERYVPLYAEEFDESKDRKFFPKYKIILTFVLVSLEAIRCEPMKSDGLVIKSNDHPASAISVGTAMTMSEIENEKLAVEFFTSPLIVKPMYAMTKWRNPSTTDGRLAIFLVLPKGTID